MMLIYDQMSLIAYWRNPNVYPTTDPRTDFIINPYRTYQILIGSCPITNYSITPGKGLYLIKSIVTSRISHGDDPYPLIVGTYINNVANITMSMDDNSVEMTLTTSMSKLIRLTDKQVLTIRLIASNSNNYYLHSLVNCVVLYQLQ